MKYQGSNKSVNVCSHCRQRNLTIQMDKAGITKCSDCIYFHAKNIYSIEQYNNWLKS